VDARVTRHFNVINKREEFSPVTIKTYIGVVLTITGQYGMSCLSALGAEKAGSTAKLVN
jgi:hypothetical protein